MTGVDPALMISRQSSGGNDGVNMVMNRRVQTPGVQDGKESNLRAHMFGITGDFDQRLGAGIEKQIEELPGRRQSQRVQFVRQGEDDMEVVGVDEIALLGLKPSEAGLRLTLGAAA